MADHPLEQQHPDTIGIPDDWLAAWIVLIGEDVEGGADAKFAQEVEAIYQMREIERREGRSFTLSADVGIAEWARRRDPDGSKRRAAEIEKLTAERAELHLKAGDLRYPMRRLLRRLAAIDEHLAELERVGGRTAG